MKIPLKDFQEESMQIIMGHLSYAKQEISRGGSSQAVILSSPTGSGKTVIVASIMEKILEGTDQIQAENDAIFLWLSDQPELNEQSRKKIIDSSDRIIENNIVIIDSFFDQETLDKGKLYFINTQKLGKDKLLVTKGDKRQFTIWETIKNTEEQFGNKFHLIIDEAHRGMNRSTRDENISTSIVQKFIFGDSDVGIPPINLIIGISATPDRFLRLLRSTQHQQSRIQRVVEIDPSSVRSSGLLKDKIVLFHPELQQSTDWTLLAAAARKWTLIRDVWNQYTTSQKIHPVHPAMVIQVEDRSDTSITRTDLETVIRTLEEEIGPIRDEEFAHCFEDDIDILVGARRIKKIEASRIHETTDIKFIFFKMSLTTGWDCPRAEVMMSFRRAQDHTLIAQLIGRMVRTPLARKVEGQELLNSVSLYLPYYDSIGLKQVVDYLKNDPDIMSPTQIEDGTNQVILFRSDNQERVFNVIEQIPTYRIETSRKVSNTRRLMKLSRLLTSFHELDSEAFFDSKTLIIDTIYKAKEELRLSDPEFDQKVNESDEILVYPVTVEQGVWQEIVGEPLRVKLTEFNIIELFNRCGKRLGEGLHLDYWSTYYDRDNPNRPKLELFLTLQKSGIFQKLEDVCGDRLNLLFDKHRLAIRALDSSEQEKYNKIREQARQPEPIPFMAPSQILVNVSTSDSNFTYYEKHLYVTENGMFPAIFNSWERQTIESEISKSDVIGWIRNYERKSWALCVPYMDGGHIKRMYPDFLVVRKIDQDFIVDVLEPHREDLDDNWKKAVGLARFAEQHWNSFGRIEWIRKVDSQLKRLNLNDDVIRSKVVRATSNDHFDTIFDALSI